MPHPGDPHRPQYHFLPPANWMNDPNGLIQWRGDYHLFYQYNPHGAFHATIHWGHAVSRDLVHWRHLPLALSPTPGGPDASGCWSGCVVDNAGTPMLLYTGVWPETQCLATGSADLLAWRKHPGNPVIAAPPLGLALTGFRDPRVWREGDLWYMAVGAGVREVGGAVLLYRSKDLIDWDYLHPLYVGDKNQTDPIWTDTMWECPDFFRLGDKHVLIISTAETFRAALYFVGKYEAHKFIPESLHYLDLGVKQFFAPQTLLDEQGRRLMWGWLWEGRSEAAQRAAGWSGVMSLPRVLSMRPDGLLGIEPAPELQMLRGQPYHFGETALQRASPNLLAGVQGDCLEIIAEFERDESTPASAFGLKLRCSPDGAEQTLLVYDPAWQRLELRREQSSLDPAVERDRKGGPLELASGEPLKLHIFLDRSVVEVFANGRACLTARIYPSRPDSLGLAPLVQGGNVRLKSLHIWEVKSIWE